MSFAHATVRSAVASRYIAEYVHLCNGLDPRRDGGMVPSILGMTGAICRGGGDLAIVTPTPSRLDGQGLPDGVRLYGPETNLERAVRDAEVVHLHGLWQGHTRRGARAARRAGVPYLVAAHGMADPWALRHKAWKKRLYTALVEGPNLRHAACLHALSRPEVGHLRALAPDTPIALVPNGVDPAPYAELPPRAELEAEHPELVGKFVLLFYGRLHVKKGLDLLAEALERIAPGWPELHVLLAGHDDGARAPFLARIASCGLADRVTYLGHLAGRAALRAWGASDAFVLPSYSEGFSMAVLEALAARRPALITTACHFPEVAREGCGWVVAPTVRGVLEGLEQLKGCTEAERAEMGRRGRELVLGRFSWDEQARRLLEVYRWLAAGGPRPAAIEAAREAENAGEGA